MNFSFNKSGNLQPAGPLETTLADLKDQLVAPFPAGSSRHDLYAGYLEYNTELKELLDGAPYEQWVNGSFAGAKGSPRDIDVVSFVPHQPVERVQKQLTTLTRRFARERFGVDAYLVKAYPPSHRYYVRYQYDRTYWLNTFGTTRPDHRKRRFEKGFLTLEF